MRVSFLFVAISVNQRCATNHRFTVGDLHRFVDQANRGGLPDETPVRCVLHADGSVAGLNALSTEHHTTVFPRVTPADGTPGPRGQSVIRQTGTGRPVHYRRWFRTLSLNQLVLRDVRALLSRVYEAGVPTDQYEITAMTTPGNGRHLVRGITARRRVHPTPPG